MNKEKLLNIINKYVGYAEQEIYNAIEEYEEEKIKFAQKHCKAALQAASESVILIPSEEDIEEYVDKQSILNAYPDENIK